MTRERPSIGIAGLTHLGINSGVAFAERGFATVWFDPSPDIVGKIESGDLPIVEPGLDNLFARNRSRIEVTSKAQALERCAVVYIAADVPTDENGVGDLRGIEALIERVSGAMSQAGVMVVLCQVPPGFTRLIDFPKHRLFYQVETLIFGRAVERALAPERFIVGCAEPARPLPPAYSGLLEAFGCPILPMRYESAELAKIAINCCLVSMISTANTLAELSGQIGADWSEIAPALKLDRRIGEHAYLTPGLGLSGGNLERDLATVIRLAGQAGTDATVVEAWVASSRHCKGWAARTLHSALYADKPEARLCVLGLAYKQDTDSTKNSPAIALIEMLEGREIIVFDPVVSASRAPRAQGAETPMAACRGVDAVAVMTPWAAFKELDLEEIAKTMRGRVLLDPHGLFDAASATKLGFEYHTLGARHAPPGEEQ